MTDSLIIQKQYADLGNVFRPYEKAYIAFSGGVDSSLVAKAAVDILEKSAIAVTVASELTAQRDIEFSKASATSIGITHKIIHVSLLNSDQISDNSKLRCYHCKRAIISAIKRAPLFDGSHAGDPLDRPGLKAIKEAGVISPLALANFDKRMVLKTAEHLQLISANRPSNSCLATRITTNQQLTVAMLKAIEETEELLFMTGVLWCRAKLDECNMRIEYGANKPLDELEITTIIQNKIFKLHNMNIKFCRIK